MKVSPPKVLDLGLAPYSEVWAKQRDFQRALMELHGDEVLIVCEHEPVITLGKSARPENLLLSRDALGARGVPVFEIERGGDVTYHGPGQLVAYPILDLSRRKRDVGWYMRSLEEILIRALASFGLKGSRSEGKTGVWINRNNAEKKIASMGVKLSRWCTMHGLALNVGVDLSGFGHINPCGFDSAIMTSIEHELGSRVPMASVKQAVIREFLAWNEGSGWPEPPVLPAGERARTSVPGETSSD